MGYIKGRKLAIFIFVTPMLLIYTLFIFFPLLPETIISLQNHNGFKSIGFVGLSNYIQILKGPGFWHANYNNLIMLCLSLLLGLPTSVAIGVLLNQQTTHLRRFIKTSGFIPSILSVTIICQMWRAIYQPDWGLTNRIFRFLGLINSNIDIVANDRLAIFTAAVPFLWQFLGFNAIIIYAGIKTIPETYYEAAYIDGANFFWTTMKITIPMLQEIIKYLLIISSLGCFAQYAHVMLITNGGPGDISRTIVFLLTVTAFGNSEFGKGSAVAVLFILECLILIMLINRFVAREKLQY